MTASAAHRLLSLSAVGALAPGLTACAGDADQTESPAAVGTASTSPASEGTGSAAPTPSPSPSASADQEPSTVAVYEDFACPHCKDFHYGVGGFLASVAQGGKAEIDYRIVDFMGQGDDESWSTRAANAFYCFRDTTEDTQLQHDYQTQLFAAAPAGLSDQQLVDRAGLLEVDIADCVAADGGSDQIEAALTGMSEDGVRGVPTMVVDGTVYDPESDGDVIDWVLEQANLSDGSS